MVVLKSPVKGDVVGNPHVFVEVTNMFVYFELYVFVGECSSIVYEEKDVVGRVVVNNDLVNHLIVERVVVSDDFVNQFVVGRIAVEEVDHEIH